MHVHAERLTGVAETAELWNAREARASLGSTRDLIGSTAAERYPLAGA
jgi:hypothetical protein